MADALHISKILLLPSSTPYTSQQPLFFHIYNNYLTTIITSVSTVSHCSLDLTLHHPLNPKMISTLHLLYLAKLNLTLHHSFLLLLIMDLTLCCPLHQMTLTPCWSMNSTWCCSIGGTHCRSLGDYTSPCV